ncbi:MAG: alpha/beta hydrolase [Deltaproteobacteria bacterium]|nr:alpha/beta hydrolase [Deltaproteobacteria bacterium]
MKRTKVFFALILSMASVLFLSCIELDGFLFKGDAASLDDYDFTSDELDGIDPARLTSELIPSGDGQIHVVYITRDESELSEELSAAPPVTIVYSHGNSANIKYYWYRAAYLEDMGFNVLMYDYRGYGASTGEASEENVYEDAMTAYEYARKRQPNGMIISYGYSMGGAPAIYLCSNENTARPIACITESTFAGTQQMVDSSGYHIPSDWLLDTEFPSAERAKKVTIPFMIMHGTDDEVVGFAHSAVLWESVGKNNPLNRYYRVEGAGHRNLPVPSWNYDKENLDKFSHPDQLPPLYHADYLTYKKRIVAFVADVMNL